MLPDSGSILAGVHFWEVSFALMQGDEPTQTEAEAVPEKGGGGREPAPYTPHPTPYTLRPTPYTLHPTPYTLHPTPYTLHPTPSTLHPPPNTIHPTPCRFVTGLNEVKFGLVAPSW